LVLATGFFNTRRSLLLANLALVSNSRFCSKGQPKPQVEACLERVEEHFQHGACRRLAHQAIPGRKTDMMDCQWIAESLRHGLLHGSYVPSPVIRDLRDLTRTRATLSQEQSGISSRIQKLLESADIKLASTVTHTMVKSGQAVLNAIVSGEDFRCLS
jgi:hypothetical protein